MALCQSQARVKEEGWWRGADIATVKNKRMKSNGRWRRVNGKAPSYGRRRERQWTPTRAKAQDTRVSPNSLETHLVRKWGDIGHLWALSPWSSGWMGWILTHQFKKYVNLTETTCSRHACTFEMHCFHTIVLQRAGCWEHSVKHSFITNIYIAPLPSSLLLRSASDPNMTENQFSGEHRNS